MKDVLVLPKSFAKGAKPTSDASYDKAAWTSVRFDIGEFDKLVARIVCDTKKGKEVLASDYYPAVRKRDGKTRELPMTDANLIAAIQDYLDERMMSPVKLRPHDPLILSQKGGAYSPNTRIHYKDISVRCSDCGLQSPDLQVIRDDALWQ